MQDLPGRVLIEADNLIIKGFSLDLVTGQVLSDEALHSTRYISAVLAEYEAKDLRIKVESELPTGRRPWILSRHCGGNYCSLKPASWPWAVQ